MEVRRKLRRVQLLTMQARDPTARAIEPRLPAHVKEHVAQRLDPRHVYRALGGEMQCEVIPADRAIAVLEPTTVADETAGLEGIEMSSRLMSLGSTDGLTGRLTPFDKKVAMRWPMQCDDGKGFRHE